MHYDYDHISLVHFFSPYPFFFFDSSLFSCLAIHRYHCITYINLFLFLFCSKDKEQCCLFLLFFMYVESEPIFF